MNQLLALHLDETTDAETTEQPRREKKNVKKRGAAELGSNSDSESEVGPAPAAGAPEERKEGDEEQHPVVAQEALVADRSLSADTLPMSPRMPMSPPKPPADVSASATDLPEPSTTCPMAFEPPTSPDGQQAVSTVIQ